MTSSCDKFLRVLWYRQSENETYLWRLIFKLVIYCHVIILSKIGDIFWIAFPVTWFSLKIWIVWSGCRWFRLRLVLSVICVNVNHIWPGFMMPDVSWPLWILNKYVSWITFQNHAIYFHERFMQHRTWSRFYNTTAIPAVVIINNVNRPI